MSMNFCLLPQCFQKACAHSHQKASVCGKGLKLKKSKENNFKNDLNILDRKKKVKKLQ